MLNSLHTSAKNEMLFDRGLNFNDVPAWQRAEMPTTRRNLRTDDDLPMKDSYRTTLTAVLTSASESQRGRW